MQRFCSYMVASLLILGLLTKPALSFWYVNRSGEVINVVDPQVLGSRYSRRTPTTTPTTRPTTRPTATPTTRPTATSIPTATRTPQLTNTQIPQPTNTQTSQPTITTTPTSSTSSATNFVPTVTTQPTITQTPTLHPTNTPIPPSVTQQPTITPIPEQQNNSSDSWWETFTENLINKSVEPTNIPSSQDTKPATNLPPPKNILRIENTNNQVGITKVDEQGNETKLGDQLWLEIQSQKTAFDQTNFREEQNTDIIRLGSGTNKGIVINRNSVSAETSLPVSVDLTTNGILVETSAGIKKVTSLPDQIVKSSEKAQYITAVDASKKIELVVENGIPVYKIDGIRKGKFFGLIPVSIQKQIFVSAEDGRLVKENLSISNQFLEKTSF